MCSFTGIISQAGHLCGVVTDSLPQTRGRAALFIQQGSGKGLLVCQTEFDDLVLINDLSGCFRNGGDKKIGLSPAFQRGGLNKNFFDVKRDTSVYTHSSILCLCHEFILLGCHVQHYAV